MKKFLVGCLVVVVVLVVAGGTAGYFLVIKPAWEFAGGLHAFTQEYAGLNEQIEHQEDFEPPADGSITSEQFQRFLVAQRDMRQAMEGRLEDLDQRFKAMEKQLEADDREAGIGEMVTAYKDLGGLLLDAKRAQVEALNRYSFSLQEYLYVRNQTYRALGQEVAVAAWGDQAPADAGQPVPEAVVEMVSPHREELMEGYVFAWFGI